MTQTMTPMIEFAGLPAKDALVKEFVGKPLTSLRTPAFVLDRSVFERNCSSMSSKTKEWGAGFRAHLKTHKVRIPLQGFCKAVKYNSRVSLDSRGSETATARKHESNSRLDHNGGLASRARGSCSGRYRERRKYSHRSFRFRAIILESRFFMGYQ